MQLCHECLNCVVCARSCAWINKDVRAAAKKGLSAGKIAELLVNRALKDGSDDNVTCIVVLLNFGG